MRSGITTRFAALVLMGVILVSPSFALAQTEAQDAARGPHIALSPAQRQIIYQSVSHTLKNQAAPTGFRVSVGAILPVGVASERPPRALVTMIPGVASFDVAMIDKQVVVLDAQTRQVAAVITEDELGDG